MEMDQIISSDNRVLIIDDDPEFRTFLRSVAEGLGCVAMEAGNLSEFTAIYDQFQPTAILLDLTMPETDGIEFLRNLAKRSCKAPVLLVSGQDERILATAERLGRLFGLTMHGSLRKPMHVATLESMLQQVWQDSSGITPETLDRAIREDELVLHFQPKIDLQSGPLFPIIGCEVLVRWMHPKLGLIQPDDFIPLAEETGLIQSLDDVVLRKTIAQLQAWQNLGINHSTAVNLSPTSLTDLDFPDRIAGLLAETDIDPSMLMVEITEQAAMADVGLVTDILTRLRLKNIAVALDDFGAGYSSLVEIYRMPLSELKLDRSLIVDIGVSADARTVVKALIALARELKLPVCAEGIETIEIANFLRNTGCATAQGFYFSRPLPADTFREHIESQPVDASAFQRRTA
jgi:EAL domain-containing protein (putative c-di-GMP-specific phosphodiesterase class I)/ActR/RegA family two-component response regulator